MAEKPTTLPTWATDGGTTVEPTSGEKAAGWVAGTRPPARWFNWWMNLLYTWIQYVDTPVGTGTGPGFAATGGSTSGPGLRGTGGGPNGKGVDGIGTGTGPGVYGQGGSSNGIGVQGVGDGNAAGVSGQGGETGVGVHGIGTGNAGVYGQATSGNNPGGRFEGSGSGSGLEATGGSSGGAAGTFTGGSSNGHAVVANATGTGSGVRGTATDGYGVRAESDTTSPARSALRIVPQNADPSNNSSGDVFVHTTTGKMRVGDGTKWNRVIGNDGRVTATEQLAGSAETAFTGVTIPAGTLIAGSVIRVHASGIGMNDGAGTGTFTLRLRIGGVAGTLVFQATALTRDSSADKHWTLDACFTVFETGASATIVGHAVLHYGVVDATPVIRITGVDDFGVNAKTIDTTAALSVVVTHDNVSGTGDTILDQFVVDVS